MDTTYRVVKRSALMGAFIITEEGTLQECLKEHRRRHGGGVVQVYCPTHGWTLATPDGECAQCVLECTL